MKRRSFFSALASLVAAPFVAKVAATKSAGVGFQGHKERWADFHQAEAERQMVGICIDAPKVGDTITVYTSGTSRDLWWIEFDGQWKWVRPVNAEGTWYIKSQEC